MDWDDPNLAVLARRVAAALDGPGWTLATAESCTGGWVAKVLTDIPGSSAWFHGGFVTYSNVAKAEMLSVPAALLTGSGAVSREVVEAMAAGAQQRTGAELAVAVSGIAGPGGGTADKPVGTVWFAWAGPGSARCNELRQFAGDREAVRRQTVAVALEGVLAAAARA
jgi:nicotinamide-nucleotide amidase